MAYLKVLSQHLPDGTGKEHERPVRRAHQDSNSVSQITVKSATCSAAL